MSGSPETAEPPLAELLRDLADDAKVLMHEELALARHEVRGELWKPKTALIAVGLGIGLAAIGGGLLIMMVVHLLQARLEPRRVVLPHRTGRARPRCLWQAAPADAQEEVGVGLRKIVGMDVDDHWGLPGETRVARQVQQSNRLRCVPTVQNQLGVQGRHPSHPW